MANQSALSIVNARACQEIQTLNADLEKKVEDRTQALVDANTKPHLSFDQLEQAYRDLQRSQENLLRAEKLAALGRLAAGIAHEMNTPLGASLTSFKLLQELVEEYKVSIGDSEVNENDHRDIAAEMVKLVSITQQWVEKAASHIRSFKLYTRDLQSGEKKAFSVLQTIADTQLLLAHRLRLSRCTLTVSCASSEEPILYGDAGKLSQVLINLILNAVEAYKGANHGSSEIHVEVKVDGEGVEIGVRDRGCGIPPENISQKISVRSSMSFSRRNL